MSWPLPCSGSSSFVTFSMVKEVMSPTGHTCEVFAASPCLDHGVQLDTPWASLWLSRWSVCLQCGRAVFNPWVGKIPWRRRWQHTPVFLPGESHGEWSLVGYSPWGHKESDTTEQLTLMLCRFCSINPFRPCSEYSGRQNSTPQKHYT